MKSNDEVIQTANKRGLYNKYKVERFDGKPINAGCIVLEFDDKIARKAILTWARVMLRNNYDAVYDDVITRLAETSTITIGVGDCLWLLNFMAEHDHWEVMSIDGENVNLKRLDHERKTTLKTMTMLEIKRNLEAYPQP